MENATKALIIAGAILISIVLISVGVSIVTGATGTIDEGLGQMDQQEKNMFNQKFEAYEGRQTGTQVKSLLTQINSNNLSNYEVDGKVISIEYEGIGSENLTGSIQLEEQTPDAIQIMSSSIATLRASINTGATYTVTLNYGSHGLIELIKIVKTVKN